MSTTVNGWPVLQVGSPSLRRWNVPDTNRGLTLRDGSAGFLLIHMAVFFDEQIELLDRAGEVWDEWGHAIRPVRGQTSGYSNHAGGIAEDLNATRHPLGVPIASTYTPVQVKAIRRRLRLYRGIVVWGGDWSRPDGMHFEIKGELPACERLARLLMVTPRGRRILAANPGARNVILS